MEASEELKQWALNAWGAISSHNGFTASNLTNDPVKQFVDSLTDFVTRFPPPER